MTPNKIQINRAPVLTLWAAIVAERLGFDHDEALSLGKALAGLNAQSKGRRLGIFKPAPKEIRKARERERGEEFWVDLLGRALPAMNNPFPRIKHRKSNQPMDDLFLMNRLSQAHRSLLVDVLSAHQPLVEPGWYRIFASQQTTEAHDRINHEQHHAKHQRDWKRLGPELEYHQEHGTQESDQEPDVYR